jgi:hypothetical protein
MNKKIEFYIVISIGIFFFIWNLTTIDRFPSVWIDEVSYSDPAVNYVMHGKFISTSWSSQPSTEFWSSNAPLHEYLLTLWLKIFGVNIISVRAFDVFLFFLSSLVFWLVMFHYQISKKTFTRIIIFIMFWCGETISGIYRCGRPDVITILLALLTFWSYHFFDKKQWPFVVCIGFLSPIAGLQLPPFIIVSLFVVFLVTNNRIKIFRFGLLYTISVFLGLVSLFAFLFFKGALLRFLQMTFASSLTCTGEVAQKVLINDSRINAKLADKFIGLLNYFNFFITDKSYLILLALLSVLLLFFLYKKKIKFNSIGFFVYIYLIMLPGIMVFLGRYPVYYWWMGYLVSLLLLAFYLDNENISKKFRTICYIILLISIFLGLPFQMAKNYINSYDEQRNIEKLILKNITRQDVVFSEHIAYYSLKKIAKESYFTSYSGGRGFPVFPNEQLQSINYIIRGNLMNLSKIKDIWENKTWIAIDSIAKPKLILFKCIK